MGQDFCWMNALSADDVSHQGPQAVSRLLYQDHRFQVMSGMIVTQSVMRICSDYTLYSYTSAH